MDELMKALKCCAESLCGECPYQKYSSTHYTLRCSYKLIADLAATDLKPERHGRWKDGKCTNCDFDIRCLIDGESEFERWVWDECFSYCPNCGAKMVLEG